MRKAFVLLAAAATLAVAACNTIAGAGRDVQAAGEAVEETARDASNSGARNHRRGDNPPDSRGDEEKAPSPPGGAFFLSGIDAGSPRKVKALACRACGRGRFPPPLGFW